MFLLLTNLQSSGMIGVGPAMLLDSSLWLAISVVVIVIVAIAGGYPALRTVTVPLVSMLRPKAPVATQENCVPRWWEYSSSSPAP